MTNNYRSEDQDALQSMELARIKQELNEANSHVVKLLSHLEASKQEISELSAKAIEHDQIAEENAVLRQKNADLETETRTLTDVNKELRAQLEASKQENIGLKKEVADLKRAPRKDEFELVEANKKVEMLVDCVSDLYTKLEEEQERLEKEAAIQSETQARRFNEILNVLDPSNWSRKQVLDNLLSQSQVKYHSEQYEEQLELLLKAVIIEESGSNDADLLARAWNNISNCWFELSSYEKALEATEKAIACNSTIAIFFYNRGLAYEALGKTNEAIADFKKCLELDPNYQDAATALAELRAEQLP